VPAPDAAELLAAYDEQLRALIPDRLPPGEQVERDGPALRFTGGPGGGWVLYRDLDGLDGAELDELIARQVRAFAERGERFEWKLHGHVRPADLPKRLRAAGLEPEELETVLIASIAEVAGPPSLPEEISLREVTERHDLERIAAMEEEVWQLADSRAPRQSRGQTRLPLPRGRRVRRQPADPRAARLRRGHHDDALRLVTSVGGHRAQSPCVKLTP
jgi:hypothetical protein